MTAEARVVGVVLAGGDSRRMGTPKALVEIDGRSLASRVADVVRAAGAEPVVLVGGEPTWGDPIGCEVVADDRPGEGPLAATATAVTWAARQGADLVVVAACDQVGLDPATIESLLATLRSASPSDAVGALAVTADGVVQPFPSVWRVSAGPVIDALAAAGERRASRLASLGVVTVPVAAERLADVDTPGELARWRATTGRPGSAPVECPPTCA